MRKTNEEYEAEVLEKGNGDYVVLERYVTSKTPILMEHKTCGNQWRIRPNDYLRGKGCPVCGRKRAQLKTRKTNEDYKEKIKDIKKQFEQLTEYTKADDKIKFRHKTCGKVFDIRAIDFARRKRCPHCSLGRMGHDRRLTHDEFLKSLSKDVISKLDIISTYVNSRTLIKTKNKSCGHINSFKPYDLRMRYNNCAHCSSSRGERKLFNKLVEEGVNFIKEYPVKILEDRTAFRFDFAILNEEGNVILLIEFDGEQHFRPIEGWGGMEAYQYVRKNDMIKNKYCRDNQIRLLRIHYEDIGNINKIIETLLRR